MSEEKNHSYIPERGDIIHINFNPSKGKEMRGERYAIVYTPSEFNKGGYVGVCPITYGKGDSFVSDESDTKMYVSLQGADTRVQGRIFCHQHKSLDCESRDIRYIEKAPEFIVDEVMSVLDAIIFSGYYDEE